MELADFNPDPILFRNNLMSRGVYGMKSSGRAEGTKSMEHIMCADSACPEDVVNHNLIVGIDRREYPNATYNACPGEARCEPVYYDWIGFSDPANGDFSLAADSAYAQAGPGGAPIGVNVSALPQILNLTIEAAPRFATFRYELREPIADIPCVLQVSEKRDLSVSVPDLDPTLFPQADSTLRPGTTQDGFQRIFTAGTLASEPARDGTVYDRALRPGTQYYYRLMCGGDTRSGTFSTTPE
jgi:hypothetical protein